MQKHYSKILLISSFSLIFSFAIAQTSFLKTFPFPSFSTYKNFKICQTNDDGYAIATDYYGEIVLLKTDVWGNILFQKSFLRNGINYSPSDIKQTSDSGFIISSNSVDQSLIIKTNFSGDTLWTKTYFVPNSHFHFDKIFQISNGNLVAFALVQDYAASKKYGSIIKMNSLGDILFSKSYERTNAWSSTYEEVTGMVTRDGGYVLQGMELNPWIKTDSLGNIQWTYVSQLFHTNSSIDTSIYNEYYLAAQNGTHIIIEKFDSTGNNKWSKTLSVSTETIDRCKLKCTNDGGFLILANTFGDNFGYGRTPCIFKGDSAGNIQFQFLPYDTTGITTGSLWRSKDIQITNDLGFICSFEVPGFISLKKFEQFPPGNCFELPSSVVPVAPTTWNVIVTLDTGYVAYQTFQDTIIINNSSFTNNTVCSNIGNASNVWPGDCNYDLSVDNFDFLYLNIANGDTGSIRQNASINWIAQPCNDWSNSFISDANHKHADTNGDGVVDLQDTAAIIQNYGNTHPFRIQQSTQQTTIPDFFIVSNADTVAPGSIVTFQIFSGTSAIPVDSIYGLAYSLLFENSLVDTTQMFFNYSNSTLGIIHSNIESFEKNFYSIGQIDAALCRTNHTDTSNIYGLLGSMQIKTASNITSTSVLHINPVTVRGITFSEYPVEFNLIGDSVVIDPSFVGINNFYNTENVNIYPNPAKNFIDISYSLKENTNAEFILYNSFSQKVKSKNLFSNTITQSISTTDLPNGIYFYQVKSKDKNITSGKLVILK